MLLSKWLKKEKVKDSKYLKVITKDADGAKIKELEKLIEFHKKAGNSNFVKRFEKELEEEKASSYVNQNQDSKSKDAEEFKNGDKVYLIGATYKGQYTISNCDYAKGKCWIDGPGSAGGGYVTFNSITKTKDSKSKDALNTKMRLGKKPAIELINKMYPDAKQEKGQDSILFKLGGETIGEYLLNTNELYYKFK